jgi:hypothetical protein
MSGERRSCSHYRWLHGLNVLLLGGLWGYSLVMAARMPDLAATGAAGGVITRWIAGGGGFWWIGPILGTIHAAFMYVLAPLVRVSPHGIGIPHKRRLLALPATERAYALEPLRAFLYMLAAWLLALMWLLQLQMYAAVGAAPLPTGQVAALFAVVIAFALLPVAGAIVLVRLMERRIVRCEAGESA